MVPLRDRFVWILTLVCLVPALAGCTADPAPLEAEPPSETDPGTSNETEVEDLTGAYRLAVPRTWATTQIDIVARPFAVGPADPLLGSWTRGLRDAVTHWQEMLDAHGYNETRGNVTLNLYVLGEDLDPPPPHEVEVFVAGHTPLAAGVAINVPPFVARMPCVVETGNDIMQGYTAQFLVHAHELGHCLGVSHPDDHEPWQDLMAYDDAKPENATLPKLDCVSNLDLLGLGQAFAPAFDRAPAEAVFMQPDDYVKYDCAERFLG